ncbi:lysis protein [Xenorhabdus sp. ZM]|uniref:lysis protein n=1 Tax=Xenorhabdus szentirmaii TaxID=290112 RepID=UPI0019C30146|nr:lysis protein [Xenorhabdus sp. ZM]MBD2803480.1 lysis protein [Xenorhabdus sp. ZM]
MKKLIIALVIALAGVSYAAQNYYSKYEKQKQDNQKKATEIQQLADRINYQDTHIEIMHELNAKHTQELANAKSEIDTLRTDVAAGRRKLRIKASCPMSETTTSGSMGNAGTPQLTESARQDYFRLREMMAENERQTKYLQDYIKSQCSK